jgi:peptide chain release factor 3
LTSDIELLDGLDIKFELSKLYAEEQTPVFFGSALTNFGVRLFLRLLWNWHLPLNHLKVIKGSSIHLRSIFWLHIQDSGKHEPEAPR